MLMRKMIDHLARRGVLRIVGQVLREGRNMQALVQAFGFSEEVAGSDADALLFVRPLQPPATFNRRAGYHSDP
jgi:hypothetical protein